MELSADLTAKIFLIALFLFQLSTCGRSGRSACHSSDVCNIVFGEKEPETCFCKIKEMDLACGELYPMQQASERVLPLPRVSENSLEHEACVLPSFLCSLGDSCLFQGVLVGEAFPHLAQ